MKFILGGFFLAVGSALLAAIPYLLPDEDRIPAVRLTFALVYILVIAGSLRGANAFGRGDKLRTAWLLFAVSGIVGITSLVIGGPPLRSLPDHLAETTTGFVFGIVCDLALNATTIAGLALFARAWSETGLLPPWQRPATLLALALGLGIAGPSLWHDANAALAGSQPAIGATISGASDIISITLAGPLLASAVWMRGGALVGPYSFLTGYAVSWLIFDAGSLITLSGHLHDYFDAYFAATGQLFAAAAGFTHYWVIHSRSSANGK